MQINLLIGRQVASFFEGAVVWLSFADRLYQLPLGVVAARRPNLGQVILGVAGILQTIPSLALFVFMIPLLGIGAAPAIVALFLYSLLPIVRNTYTGIHTIPAPIIESARALGLPPATRLRVIELPLDDARYVLSPRLMAMGRNFEEMLSKGKHGLSRGDLVRFQDARHGLH